MESILTSIKKLLGIQDDYKHFDEDIIIHINSAFMILTQLGVGPSEGFSISDEYSTWEDFIPENEGNFNMVKSYIHHKVKLLFDPPMSSAVMEAMNRMISEMEWRLNIVAEEKRLDVEEEIQNG